MRWAYLSFLLWLAATSPVACAQSNAPVPSVQQYARSVHLIRLALDRVRAGAPATSRKRALAESSLRGLDRVRLPDGRILRTDTPRLADTLSIGTHSAVSQATSAIDRLDDALSLRRERAVSAHDLSQLDAVLRDPRFQENPLQRLRDSVVDQARRLLSGVTHVLTVSPLVEALVVIAFLALVGVLAVLAARGALGKTVVEVAERRDDVEPRTAASARERADAAAAAGDYRTALRYLFIATLLGLQERGELQLAPGLTNRDYLGALRSTQHGRGTTHRDLLGLVDDFDRAWYGHLPFGPDDYARCQTLSRQVLERTMPERAA